MRFIPNELCFKSALLRLRISAKIPAEDSLIAFGWANYRFGAALLFEFAVHILIAWWPFWVLLGITTALILLLRTWTGPERMPYVARGHLVTKPELRFYKSLVKAVQDDWEIFAMVRIADLLRVEKGHKNYRKWLNKILAKHIDFVLCHPGTLEPQVCIELDDASHNRPDRIERDIFVNAAFDAAELPLLRIPTQTSYRAREIRDMIDDVV